MCNMLGGVPYSTAITAQLSITFAIAGATFIGIVIIFAMNHGIYAFSTFLPAGSPVWIAPLLVIVEIVSYFFRPISLSVRLFANIMAGHILIVMITALGLKYVPSFALPYSAVFGTIIILLLMLIVVLESAVQLIQAYVFTLLTCNYINGAIFLDH